MIGLMVGSKAPQEILGKTFYLNFLCFLVHNVVQDGRILIFGWISGREIDPSALCFPAYSVVFFQKPFDCIDSCSIGV